MPSTCGTVFVLLLTALAIASLEAGSGENESQQARAQSLSARRSQCQECTREVRWYAHCCTLFIELHMIMRMHAFYTRILLCAYFYCCYWCLLSNTFSDIDQSLFCSWSCTLASGNETHAFRYGTKQIANPASHIECFTKRDTRSCLLNIFRTPPSLPSFPGRLPKSASDSYLVISLPFCPQRNCIMFALVHAGRDRLKGARMCGCITDLLHAVELLIAVLV